MMDSKAYAEKVKRCIVTIEKLRRHMRTEGLLEATENANIDFAIAILLVNMISGYTVEITEDDTDE